MAKPDPLSEEQVDNILSRADDELCSLYDIYEAAILHPDDLVIGVDDEETIFSEMPNEEKEDFIDSLEEQLGITRYFKNVTLLRKLNICIIKEDTFELLESHKSGDFFKLRDAKGNIFTYYERNKF
ncbi:hypothetical protein [Methanolobus profundi]|uniref:Uncharacterized protein n=1 Tax=Methanolobus profundi TaxID=487685 RepID=A0A1I4V0E2_9EURY|nr:hypothetical protein [Methanolobus profundi]SFM94636.1 hypothetical protein SAMN04488696_2960 [Methanolobus profundi]SFM95022.1 hypothetical protein SAMN04488696_2971 [Methanolobus profundi]